jgi:hypothetical protein
VVGVELVGQHDELDETIGVSRIRGYLVARLSYHKMS